MNYIEWNEFERVEIKVGTIIDAQVFEKARKPAYKLWIDFGPIGIKKSSAQITHFYQIDDLINTQVVAVVNFKPKQIADFMSECLVLGVYDENQNVILLRPDHTTTNGNMIG